MVCVDGIEIGVSRDNSSDPCCRLRQQQPQDLVDRRHAELVDRRGPESCA
jgi:hypothetical protein